MYSPHISNASPLASGTTAFNGLVSDAYQVHKSLVSGFEKGSCFRRRVSNVALGSLVTCLKEKAAGVSSPIQIIFEHLV
jgi:hypothetical protein